jgi:ABC-type Mn2+/Zn2+ transport system ATPase subunit
MTPETTICGPNGSGKSKPIDDRKVIELMLKATGEDYDESEAWKLRLFVDYMNAAAQENA